MKRIRLAVAALCFVATITARAQERQSIDALIADALANNAELQAYAAEVASAKGLRTQAGFFKNPEVSVEIGSRQVRDSENVLQGNGTTLSFSVLQTLEFPGKGTLRKAIANNNIEIAELGLEQFRLALAGQVRLLALTYLANQEEALAAESVYSQSRELANLLNSQGNFGARVRIETTLVQASLVELAAGIKAASLRSEEARTRLNALVGRPQNLPLKLSDGLAAPKDRRWVASAVIFAAENNNPMLKIRKRELERATRELVATRLDVAPDFAIGPFFSRDVAGDTEQNIGGAVSATLPLWDWKIGNIQSAKAREEAAAALRVKAEREMEAEILSLIKAYELTQRQLSQIPSGLLGEVKDSSALAGTQFRNGSIGAQLYLDTQSAYLKALQASQEAVLDAWRVMLDLHLLTGGRFDGAEAKK